MRQIYGTACNFTSVAILLCISGVFRLCVAFLSAYLLVK